MGEIWAPRGQFLADRVDASGKRFPIVSVLPLGPWPAFQGKTRAGQATKTTSDFSNALGCIASRAFPEERRLLPNCPGPPMGERTHEY